MKYSEELVKDICKFVEAGNSHRDSALLCDVGESTFYDWIREKEADGSPNPNYHVEFVDTLKKAELKCKSRNIMYIQQASMSTWTAAAWLLERRYNSEWGQNHDIMDRLTAIEQKLSELEVKK